MVSNHHQAEVEYIQDHVVALPPMVKSCMDMNSCNTEASSLECRPMEPYVEQLCPLPPHVALTPPMSHNTSHMQ